MSKQIKHPETIALHGGDYRSDPATTAVAVPVYRTDNVAILSSRIREQEHKLLPLGVAIAAKRLRL